MIKKLTSVEEYRAEKRQRDVIMKKITVDNYEALKKNIAGLSKDDNTAWIKTIEKAISNAGE